MTTSPVKDTLAVIGVLLLVVGLSFGGWELYWGLKSSSVNHNAQLYQQSYGAQTAYVEELHGLIVQLDTIDVQIADPTTTRAEVSALEAQKAAMITQACGLEQGITNPPPDEAAFAASNC